MLVPAQGGQSQEADNSLGPLWITLGLFILGGFLWYFFSAYIIGFVLNWRLYEIKFINLIIPADWSKSLATTQQFIITAKEANYAGVSLDDLFNVSNTVGRYLCYPICAILIGLGVLVYYGNPVARYKRKHSMKTLLQSEKNNWPQIIPVAKIDLAKTDIDSGPWAMALQPKAFAKKHNLLIIEKTKTGASRFATKTPPTASIKRDEARRLFAMQMGRYWTNPETLPIHTRALFTVFAARINGDNENANKLLQQIARSTDSGSPNYSGTDQLLQKYKNNKQITTLTKRHAFELTVLASMLSLARQDGVLASADFLWLKPVDRRLWFMLNCVGRQTPFTEVAGPFAHWIAEIEFGRRLNVPMVEEAVNGLEKAMKEFAYYPEKEEASGD